MEHSSNNGLCIVRPTVGRDLSIFAHGGVEAIGANLSKTRE